MKIQGKTIECPNIIPIPIIRNDQTIYFMAGPVVSYDEFDKLCPAPEPPVKVYPNGDKIKDITNKDYIEKIDQHNEKRIHWTVLKSLEATEGLEWETVDPADSSTWSNYVEELKKAQILPVEITRIRNSVFEACGLTNDKIEQAKKDFLAGQAKKQKT